MVAAPEFRGDAERFPKLCLSRGYPLVFRVGATGSNLGSMSSHFAATVLAPRLNTAPGQLRMVTFP